MIFKKKKVESDEDFSVVIDENGEIEKNCDEYFEQIDPDLAKKKKHKRRKDMTPAEKKKKTKRDLLITFTVFACIGVLIGIFALSGFLGAKTNLKMISKLDVVGSRFDTPEKAPKIDSETGYTTFYTDDNFRIMQLTDVHLGAGAFSIQKDNWAINAVATLVKNERPDLVVVTGDIAYPIPFQAGTFNNLREANLFASLMERLGVYWVPVFGNHDTEVYSKYDREDISNFYADEKWKYCLFEKGFCNDERGYGNSIINICNTDKLITQSLVLLDSHSYLASDAWGAGWEYDNIHQSQIDWYEREIIRLNDINKTRFSALTAEKQASYATTMGFENATEFSAKSMIKSLAFFHIPLREYRDAYSEYVKNDKKNTANVEYIYGLMGEPMKEHKGVSTYGVWCGSGTDKVFETMIKLGSTQGVFCGHDHYNNFSLNYTKTVNVDGKEYTGTIRLTYGMSIDYLAYIGIVRKTEQRGGTTIDIANNAQMTLAQHRLSDY